MEAEEFTEFTLEAFTRKVFGQKQRRSAVIGVRTGQGTSTYPVVNKMDQMHSNSARSCSSLHDKGVE